MMVLSLPVLFTGCKDPHEDRLTSVAFIEVTFTDDLRAPRLETNRKVTVPYDFRKCEQAGRIDNFAKAGGLMEGEFEGIYFNDSDLNKVIEGGAEPATGCLLKS